MAGTRENAIEEKSNEGPDLLFDLPDEILKYSIFNKLLPSAYIQLTKASHKFAIFSDKRAKIGKMSIGLLLYFVSHGKKDQAEALIAEDPDLLLLEGKARDYSGRKLQGTALEIALGAEDVNLYTRDGTLLGEGMVEMIHRHLRKLPNGEAEITRQTLKQFPEGWEEQEEKRHERDLQALCKVREAIRISRNNEECKAALLEFKKHLAPQGIIATGKHWNAKLLLAAFQMGYQGYFRHIRKDNLFFNKVIGSIQTYAPANYAMAQAQGLYFLLKRREKFERDLKYRRGLGHYFSDSKSLTAYLGSRIWADCYFGEAGLGGEGIGCCGNTTYSFGAQRAAGFKYYLRAKTTAFRSIMPIPDIYSKPSNRRGAIQGMQLR